MALYKSYLLASSSSSLLLVLLALDVGSKHHCLTVLLTVI